MGLRAIGCDVGPRKGGHLFDGREFTSLTPARLSKEFCRLRKEEPGVVVAWDAPLTGPPNLEKVSGSKDFTQRPIEAFFRSSAWGFKAPKGISVLPYSGCSHWTISQHILGLPRIGPFSVSAESLPFDLLFDRPDPNVEPMCKPSVVEVHPAVAIWLWCKPADPSSEAWVYKKNPSKVEELWELLQAHLDGLGSLPRPKDDDQLDAMIAWLLVDRWLGGDGVILLGDQRSGAFLVPKVQGLQDSFEKFLATRPGGKKVASKSTQRAGAEVVHFREAGSQSASDSLKTRDSAPSPAPVY